MKMLDVLAERGFASAARKAARGYFCKHDPLKFVSRQEFGKLVVVCGECGKDLAEVKDE